MAWPDATARREAGSNVGQTAEGARSHRSRRATPRRRSTAGASRNCRCPRPDPSTVRPSLVVARTALTDRGGHREPRVPHPLGQRRVVGRVGAREPHEERGQQLSHAHPLADPTGALDVGRALQVHPDPDDHVAERVRRRSRTPAGCRPPSVASIRSFGHLQVTRRRDVADRLRHAGAGEQREQPGPRRRQRRTQHDRAQQRPVGHVGPRPAQPAAPVGLVPSGYQRPLGRPLPRPARSPSRSSTR